MPGTHETLLCPAELESIGRAREWVRSSVGRTAHLPAELLDDAALLTSELVTLAYRDGVGQLRVRLAHDGYAIRIDVTDEHPETVERLRAPSEDAVARALDIVHGVSADWGWGTDGHGHKIVWAVVVPPDA